MGFSDGFVALRSLLFGRYSANWFSSFGRIPSALFDAEVRVRNTIHIGTNAGTRANWSTRLHRWFQAERPTLFPTLSYAAFEPSSWSGRVPKLGDQKLLDMFEQLNRTFGGAVGKATGNGPESRSLYFKKTAYNWLTFCNTLPPCYDTNGDSIPHTKFGEVQFPQAASRDFHYLALNTKYQFAFWVAVGDDFDLTRRMFTESPLTPTKLSPADRLFVRSTAARLEEAMASATSFKLNAGKRVGNYNLALCRDVTEDVDRWLLARLGFAEAWENLELLYAQTVKTDFGLEDSDEHES